MRTGIKIWQGANRRSARAGVVAAYALLQIAQAAWAQSANPEDAAQEGLRRQEERSRQQQHQLEPKADVLKPATGHRARPADLPPEERCFTVRELRLQGQDWERFTWVADAALPYLGRCLGVQGLARVAGQLDEQLVSRGFVTTRVSLPSQNLQSGVLQIQIHVGRIADIRLVDVGPAGPQPGTGTWSNAFPMSQGDILNIRDIEQGVEQMKRLPSQSVTTHLEPGPQPDTSILVIQRPPSQPERRPELQHSMGLQHAVHEREPQPLRAVRAGHDGAVSLERQQPDRRGAAAKNHLAQQLGPIGRVRRHVAASRRKLSRRRRGDRPAPPHLHG